MGRAGHPERNCSVPWAQVRIRDRANGGRDRVRFSSPSCEWERPPHLAACAGLYLRGVYTGDFREALAAPHGPLHLVIDSTGLKLFGKGEWDSEKHG